MRRRASKVLLLLVLGLLAACSNRPPAPIHDRSAKVNTYQRKTVSSTRTKRPSNYVVHKGDTLYSIAWRYGLDHKTLGSWNGLGSPFTIFPGQKLRLTAPRSHPADPVAASHPVASKVPATAARPVSSSPPAPRRATVAATRLKWQWPARGRVVQSFDSKDPGAQGLDIEGILGQDILAAAAGEVVYSWVGLICYGELIIIKHDQHLLSAYGHNRKRLVKEGDHVQAGQRIAEMGKADADQPLLHFEIRKDGQPLDPKRYLR